MAKRRRSYGAAFAQREQRSIEYCLTRYKLEANPHPELCEGPCHIYTGGLSKEGYGQLSTRDSTGKQRFWYAHREAYKIATGKEPTQHVLHKCGVYPCINPAHLYEGTDKDNYKDAVLHGTDVNTVRWG